MEEKVTSLAVAGIQMLKYMYVQSNHLGTVQLDRSWIYHPMGNGLGRIPLRGTRRLGYPRSLLLVKR